MLGIDGGGTSCRAALATVDVPTSRTSPHSNDPVVQATAVPQVSLLSIPDAPPDLLAVLLREADRHLGTVLGDTMPADLLNDLFSRFCIGK